MPQPESCELTILMPCLNEAETLEICIVKARAYLESSGVVGEVVIADNGSTDGSQGIARACGARVVDVPVRGYGAALRAGIEAARANFVMWLRHEGLEEAVRKHVEKAGRDYQLELDNLYVSDAMGSAILAARPDLSPAAPVRRSTGASVAREASAASSAAAPTAPRETRMRISRSRANSWSTSCRGWMTMTAPKGACIGATISRNGRFWIVVSRRK